MKDIYKNIDVQKETKYQLVTADVRTMVVYAHIDRGYYATSFKPSNNSKRYLPWQHHCGWKSCLPSYYGESVIDTRLSTWIPQGGKKKHFFLATRMKFLLEKWGFYLRRGVHFILNFKLFPPNSVTKVCFYSWIFAWFDFSLVCTSSHLHILHLIVSYWFHKHSLSTPSFLVPIFLCVLILN